MMLQKYWQKKEVNDAQTMTRKSCLTLAKKEKPLSQHEQLEICLDALANDRLSVKQTLSILSKFLERLDVSIFWRL
jgi:hypothetical protein